MKRALLYGALGLIMMGCGPVDHRTVTWPRRTPFEPGGPGVTEWPISGVWRDNAASFFNWSPDTSQVVITGVEFWRYPPLQGEKKVGYIVLDGHWSDSLFTPEGIAYHSFPDSVAHVVNVTCQLSWHSSVGQPVRENVDSMVYSPAITGSATVSISGGLWGSQVSQRPIAARREP